MLCTWPKGGRLSLPFVYWDEVWTGFEYQVASHLMMMGEVEKGLEIVRTARDRYDGNVSLKNGKPSLNVVYGDITVKGFVVK